MGEADIVLPFLPLKEGSIDRKDSHQLRRSMQAQILYATTTTESAAQVFDSTVTAKKITQYSSYQRPDTTPQRNNTLHNGRHCPPN